MIRIWLITLLMVQFLGAKVCAQSYHIGLSGGINYSTLNNAEFDLWKTGPSFGFNFEWRFTKHFFLEAGLMYNERGAVQSVNQFKGGGTPEDKRVAVEFYNHYLSFPISVGLRTGNKVALFGQFGTVFSRILSSRIVYPPGGLLGQEGLIIDRINLHSVFDLTVMLRVGVIAEVTNRFETFVSGTLEHGIFGLNTAVGQHMGFLGHVGIKYRVGKAME